MEGLRQDVEQKVRCFVTEYVAGHMDQANLFCGTGQAYIQLAKEEPHLFKIFTLHQRNGISLRRAEELHSNMLIYTMGLSTIFSMTTPGISTEEICMRQEMAYEAFLKQVLKEDG
jgi:hypothetical protein